jgi:hypothetical protein
MDPNQMQQMHAAGALFAGMMGTFLLIAAAVAVFMIFLFWRIFTKAGMPGALSLILLLGPIGMLINACILAFGQWKVAPVAAAVPYYPPPAYPPASTTQG